MVWYSYPLAAPWVSPAMNSFWAKKKMMRPGKRTMMQNAYNAPVVSSNMVKKRDRPIGRVCIPWSRIISRGQRKLFQDQINARITFVAIADLESGNMIRQTIFHSGSPSIRAASIRDLGTASKLALKTKMQMIVDNKGRAIPKWPLSRPNFFVIRYAGMMVTWNGIIMQLI